MSPICLLLLVQVALVAAHTASPAPAGSVLDMANNKRQKALEFYPWGSAFPNMYKRSIIVEAQPEYEAGTEGDLGLWECVDQAAYECGQLARKGGCERSRLVQSKCPKSCKLC